MDSFRIIALALILFSIAVIHGSAMVTSGACSGEVISYYDLCTAPGFQLSDTKSNVTFDLIDVDDNPPAQAWIKISAFWDNVGVYGYDESNLVTGVVYRYSNPSDSNDFVEFTLNSIWKSDELPYIEFGDINYQQTFYVSTGGSDLNNGNVPSNSWATIDKAVDTIRDGVDVIVSSGNYDGYHTFINWNGLSNAPIIFKGDGSYPVWGASSWGDLNIWAGQYFNFSGFTFPPQNTGEIEFGCNGVVGHINIYDNYITNNKVYPYYGAINYYSCNAGLSDIHIFNNTFNGDYIFYINGGSQSANTFNNNFVNSTDYGVFSNAAWNIDGNYWIGYTGIDINGDKIGDTPMETGVNDDAYPKMDRESGYVKYSNGTAVDGATVSQIGATYRNTTSDASGYYALSTIGRDTITLFAQKNSSFGNATVTYDSSNANITIGVSGYNNTNTIIFSSDSNPANEINHSAIDTYFWANVWIEDYDPEHDYYSLRVYYPNGDLKDPDAVISDAQPAQVQYKINSNEDYGNYLFISHSYYFDEDLANNTILIHNASDINDSVHNCDCIDHCTPGYFVSTRFCINPYADYAGMYFSSDISGLNKISSAFFNHTVYLQISHPNGDYTNYSYNISILKPDNSPFYNWTTTTEYGYASWYTPSIAVGTWTVNFVRKNLTDSSELVMNTTSLYLSDEGTPPPVILSSISGYVREIGSLNAIYQASVAAGSYSTSTNAMGYYNLTNMLNGNYTVTASKTGYNSSSINKTINNASFTNVNFLLNCTGVCPTPTSTGTPTGSPTPTPTGTGGGITPGSTTDADIATMFWTMLFLVLVLYIIAFFWTIGDKE